VIKRYYNPRAMMKYKFMVDSILPDVLTDEFMSMVPFQRAVVDHLLSEGRMLSYALSLDTGRLWAIFNAESEMEVYEMLMTLPLTEFMTYDISMLTLFNLKEQPLPSFSSN